MQNYLNKISYAWECMERSLRVKQTDSLFVSIKTLLLDQTAHNRDVTTYSLKYKQEVFGL